MEALSVTHRAPKAVFDSHCWMLFPLGALNYGLNMLSLIIATIQYIQYILGLQTDANRLHMNQSWSYWFISCVWPIALLDLTWPIIIDSFWQLNGSVKDNFLFIQLLHCYNCVTLDFCSDSIFLNPVSTLITMSTRNPVNEFESDNVVTNRIKKN